jgi:ribosomal protein L37AE/L43A
MESEKEHGYKCPHCKDTGIQKFKPLSPMTDYRWIPWSEHPCPYCRPTAYEIYKRQQAAIPEY